jgi:hypothetical protein
LEAAVSALLAWVERHAYDLLQQRGAVDSYNKAMREFARAPTLVRIVLDLVRGRDVTALRATLERIEREAG